MTPVKKILFLSCSAGAGHVRAAEALYQSCLAEYPQIEARHINVADFFPGWLRHYFVGGYEWLVRTWPMGYGLLFWLTNHALFQPRAKWIYRAAGQTLRHTVREFNPDRIVSTYFLVPSLLTKSFACPLDMVITDYYAHETWRLPQVRYFFVGSTEVANELQTHGFSALPTGLPIHPRFYTPFNLTETRTRLQIAPNEPTVVALAGGSGLIDSSSYVAQILKALPNANILAVAGKNNPHLLKKLQQFSGPNYRVVEYLDTIDEWMRLADAIITKPGGVTVAEALFLQKPLILISPIPGQEEKNTTFVEHLNYGRLAKNPTEAVELLKKILSREIIFSKMDFAEVPNRVILSKVLSD